MNKNNEYELPSGRILDLMVKNVTRNDPLTIEEMDEIKTIRPLLTKEQWTKWLQFAREEKFNRSLLKTSNQIIQENTNIISSSPKMMSNPAKKISPPKLSPSKSNNSRSRSNNNDKINNNIINSPPRLNNQSSQNIINDDSFEIENNIAIIEDFVNNTMNSSSSSKVNFNTLLSSPPRLNRSIHSVNETPRLNKSSNNNNKFGLNNNVNRIDIVNETNETPRLNKSLNNIVNNSFEIHNFIDETIHSPKPISPPKLYPSTKYRHKLNENSSTKSAHKQSPTKSFPYFSPTKQMNQMNHKSELDCEKLINNYDIDRININIHKAISLAHSTGTRIESIYSVAKCLMTFLEDKKNDNIDNMGK